MEGIDRSVRSYLPGVSDLGAVTVICLSAGMDCQTSMLNPSLPVIGLSVQTVFSLANHSPAVIMSRMAGLGQPDSYALLHGPAIRNLGTSIGLAATIFGSEATRMVSLAFLIQPVAVA